MMAEWLADSVLLCNRELSLDSLVNAVTFVFIKGAESQVFWVTLVTLKIAFKLKETLK